MPSINVDDLDPKREKALVALLGNPTIETAARAAGLSERTLHRYLAEPAFAEAYHAARRQSLAQAIWLTQRYAAVAVQTLAKIMTDPGSKEASRIAAANILLKLSHASQPGGSVDEAAPAKATIDEVRDAVNMALLDPKAAEAAITLGEALFRAGYGPPPADDDQPPCPSESIPPTPPSSG